jgi:hypothetical protein
MTQIKVAGMLRSLFFFKHEAGMTVHERNPASDLTGEGGKILQLSTEEL